ncbi:hypothetical protein HDU96_000838 [Phlyctochytrium bullatum]|nr:hypothetical protein HDU96_000838 [Phlyctochytrium bullatum]
MPEHNCPHCPRVTELDQMRSLVRQQQSEIDRLRRIMSATPSSGTSAFIFDPAPAVSIEEVPISAAEPTSVLEDLAHLGSSDRPVLDFNDAFPSQINTEELDRLAALLQNVEAPQFAAPVTGAAPDEIMSGDYPRLIDVSGLRRATQSSTTPRSARGTNFRPLRILVVDDNEVVRKIASRILQQLNCTCDMAEDGQIALNLFTSNCYDLILMDIYMPNLDGIRTAKEIRRSDTWTPIIAMTSVASDDDRIEYRRNGMTDTLSKPFGRNALKSILER